MRGRSGALGLLLVSVALASLAGAWPAAAQDPDALVAPYLRGRDEHVVGEVVGQAHGDPTRPSMPSVPYEGVSVMLLPYSAEIDGELDAIKARLRDSLRNYMEAAAEVAGARAAYERALLAAGGGELIRGEVSDARGVVRLAEVPAGQWLLLAWRAQANPAKIPKLREKEDATAFRDTSVSAGYSVVSYWRLRLSVRPGETTSVDLNDRNIWLTVVREDLRLIDGTSRTAGPKKRR